MSKPIIHAVLAAALLAGAARSLAQTVPPNTPEQQQALAAVLKSDAGLKEKVDACRGLAVIGTKDAVPVLAGLLGDKQLSHMARYALETIPDPSVDDALRDALGKLKGRPLVGVIGSVGVRRDAKAAGQLAGLLGDQDAEVVVVAARSLGRIATPEAAKALQDRLGKAPAEVRPAVADGCLACAEALLAQGKRDEAAAIYDLVAKADVPKHVRLAAIQGAIQARQPAEGR
jgi:HEAT repeat protein